MVSSPGLDVRLHGQPVGTVAVEPDGPCLRRAPGTDTPEHTPLSLSLTPRLGPQPIGPWLDGLLPDSIAVRRAWARRHQAADSRPMSLLATPIGLDCAGAVQFVPSDEPWPPRRGSGIEWASDADIGAWIARARDDWGDWDGPQGRGMFSLGGAQAKCAVRHESGRWGLPYGDEPTTHILKPGVNGLHDADVVEHLCLETARLTGLDACRSSLIRFGGQRVLAVERYDRSHPDDGPVRRLHQEDLCQSLGLPPDLKYQASGGPSPAQIAEHLHAHSAAGADDVLRFAEAVAFNWLICAPDAHAKNYSVVLERGDVWLAPSYDLISVVPFASRPATEQLMSMSIDGDTVFGEADNAAYWVRFADAVGLRSQPLLASIAQMTRRVPAALRAAVNGLPEPDQGLAAVETLTTSLEHRCAAMSSEFPDVTRGTHIPDLSQLPRTSATPAATAVLCRHNRHGRICQRRLLTRPCPLHPHSTGSREILARQR